MVNKHLLHDLTEMGLWSPVIKNKMIHEDGSVQEVSEIPDELKVIYKCGLLFPKRSYFPMLPFWFGCVLRKSSLIKTVWEIKQKTLVDMVVDRGCYIDQSQSLNIHMNQPSFDKLTALNFHAWSKVWKYFYLHNGGFLKILMEKFR